MMAKTPFGLSLSKPFLLTGSETKKNGGFDRLNPNGMVR
ncbi:hypothetical protein FHS49_002194 [Sphingobium boeckii]|uniref:Uncharacterized protein n=1 Tax=Sphingobium boeckii TaxID=1082345 RepID=A0A7W9EEE6_9SPHN|nr:hypothetical protein [Sphingobium boeckii]